MAQRKLVVDKMDKQFAHDMKMRKEMNALSKRSTQIYGNLKVLQKVSEVSMANYI